MLNIQEAMGKLREMQTKVQEVQDNLAHIKTTAEAGAGMVKVTVNGKKQILELEIDNDLMNPQDKEMTKDLIIAAINKALIEVEELSKNELQKVTESLIPGGMPDMSAFGL
ncbi:MAG: YbaB/EbfC family nucleoid-associated protein [Bacteroidetes bacterium]|jgi:nucleoid-associated protein EbfC|nr:MAG: YbaB/EbfC family nucleoid-associated protein [Bacteroidota bacterium]